MTHLLRSQRALLEMNSPLRSFSFLGRESFSSLLSLSSSRCQIRFSSVYWLPTSDTTFASAANPVLSRLRQQERRAGSETTDIRFVGKQQTGTRETEKTLLCCFLVRRTDFPKFFSFSLLPSSAYSPSAIASYTTLSLAGGVRSLSSSFVTSRFSSSSSTSSRKEEEEEAELSSSLSSSSQSVLQEDTSLLGRYSLALFKAALQQSALDKVYADVSNLKMLVTESADFKLFIESPGMDPSGKEKVIADLRLKHKFHEVTVNFLKVLLENKRLSQMAKMIDAFEELYRKHNGEVKCVVTSAKELTNSQQKEVISALQKRVGKKSKLIPEFHVQPAIVGGLVVRLGDSMLDFSVNSRVESLQSQLMQSLH